MAVRPAALPMQVVQVAGAAVIRVEVLPLPPQEALQVPTAIQEVVIAEAVTQGAAVAEAAIRAAVQAVVEAVIRVVAEEVLPLAVQVEAAAIEDN